MKKIISVVLLIFVLSSCSVIDYAERIGDYFGNPSSAEAVITIGKSRNKVLIDFDGSDILRVKYEDGIFNGMEKTVSHGSMKTDYLGIGISEESMSEPISSVWRAYNILCGIESVSDSENIELMSNGEKYSLKFNYEKNSPEILKIKTEAFEVMLEYK